MKHRNVCGRVVALVLSMMVLPLEIHAASALHKAIFTFGGLNERSGVLFVARDAGIFHKHGLDATVVNVRNAAVGMSALASGKHNFTLVPPPVLRSAPWPVESTWRSLPA
jgi:ABC-type nitrate/sulfonate/bicarbonate transport system substrate-binding protein